MKARLEHAGVILLAGGRSSRMGRDKALMLLPGGRTLVQNAADASRALGFGQILLSMNGPSPIKGIAAIPDDVPGLGPLGGILSCLRRTRCDWNFVWPVDVPYLPHALIAEMIASAFSGNAEAVVLTHKGYLEPLICALHSSAAVALKAQLAEGNRKAGVLFSRIHAVCHPYCGDEPGLMNLNVPGDFRHVLALGARSPYL